MHIHTQALNTYLEVLTQVHYHPQYRCLHVAGTHLHNTQTHKTYPCAMRPPIQDELRALVSIDMTPVPHNYLQEVKKEEHPFMLQKDVFILEISNYRTPNYASTGH